MEEGLLQVEHPASDATQREEIAENVFKLVERVTGISAEKMRKDPQLRLNASIDGDDAVDLLEAFAKEFEVNMQGFVYERYFGSEGIRDPISTLFGWIRQLWRPASQLLTARALVDSAVARHWVDRSE
jgi:hypothetical protein